jgi:hypothetical protein
MKPPIPYAGKWPKSQQPHPERRIRLVPTVRKPQGDLVLMTEIVSEPKQSMPLRPASADEVKRVVREGWRDGLLLREIAERTGISLKRIHWAAMRLMRP